MKNVHILTKLRRLIKSLAVSFFLVVISLAGSSFRLLSNLDDEFPSVRKDSAMLDKAGFKSLFATSTFDPAKPYISQINARAVPFVQDYIRKQGSKLEKMKIWGKPYFDMYDGIFAQYGLPKELKYLSVIESSLAANVVSWAGAVGPWQIMAPEAREAGLVVNSRLDERTNHFKSTQAAARILKSLYGQFDDWLLVVAAYNCGAGRVRQAIRKSGSRDFWNLQAYLPLETRNHVKKFIGTHYLFEGAGGLTTMTAAELNNFKSERILAASALPITSTVKATGVIQVSGKYFSGVVASNLGMELSVFNKLNPNFDKQVSTGNIYQLNIPNEKAELFKTKKNIILNESVEYYLNAAGTTGR